MNQKDILSEYNRTKSIKVVSRNLKISETVVHKVLVAYGVIDTPLTRRIAELRRVGLSQKHIAEMLGISTSSVNKNTPYERGTYLNPSTSANAERIRKCRAKKDGERSIGI